jgi:hypothetical protein
VPERTPSPGDEQALIDPICWPLQNSLFLPCFISFLPVSVALIIYVIIALKTR